MRVGELWDEMMALEHRMDDLFRSRLYVPALKGMFGRAFVPTCDVFRKNGDMVVELELPGIDPEKDVKVTLEGGDLVVRGERKRTKEISDEDYYRKETSYGSFERYVSLPEGIREKDIKAEYHDGVLEIRLPVTATQVAAPKARAIPIKTGGGKTKAA